MKERVDTVEFDVGGAFERNASGAITGRVVVRVGDATFPDAEWFDFIEVIEAWAEAVVAGGDAILHFMDGPYEIRIREVRDGDTLELSLIARTAGGTQIVKAAHIRRPQLRNALRSACKTLAARLEQSGYHQEALRFQDAMGKL